MDRINKNTGKPLLFRFDQNFLYPLLALAGILLFNLLFTEGFFRIEIKNGHLFGSLIDILNRGAPVMLITIGMTLVYATGGVDLSVGAVMAISGALAAQIIRPGYVKGILEYGDQVSLIIVLLVPLALSILFGLWNGFLVAVIGVQPIIATLILMTAGRGIAQLITHGQIIVFEHDPFQFVGSGFFLAIPFPIIIVALLCIVTWLITRKTSLGLFIEASGANSLASRYMGIRVKLITALVYGFSGFCAGLAGLIICADIRAADANNAGLFLELDAIASVIIGGTVNGGRFTLAGSIVGALIIQALTTTIITRGIPPQVVLVFKAFIIILVALIQSDKLKFYMRKLKKGSAA
ncbi:MAG: ABC transporter permease [Spirochaetales bacterium]|nr:ABC transporter permease [Spirochaetales bacterium]